MWARLRVMESFMVRGVLRKAASGLSRVVYRATERYVEFCEHCQAALSTMVMRGDRCLRDARGQGTTEYAILVGVLVVIAIIAVIAFRGKLQELWTSISEGINGL
jgi:Flp pilus assembly pilin Flp